MWAYYNKQLSTCRSCHAGVLAQTEGHPSARFAITVAPPRWQHWQWRCDSCYRQHAVSDGEPRAGVVLPDGTSPGGGSVSQRHATHAGIPAVPHRQPVKRESLPITTSVSRTEGGVATLWQRDGARQSVNQSIPSKPA